MVLDRVASTCPSSHNSLGHEATSARLGLPAWLGLAPLCWQRCQSVTALANNANRSVRSTRQRTKQCACGKSKSNKTHPCARSRVHPRDTICKDRLLGSRALFQPHFHGRGLPVSQAVQVTIGKVRKVDSACACNDPHVSVCQHVSKGNAS